MFPEEKHKPSCKIWIEYKGKPVIGRGGARILKEIKREKSISKVAEKLGMSYRYVWNYLRKIEKALGRPVVETYKGGKSGGGGATLTNLGKDLLLKYERVERYVGEILEDEEYWEAIGLKISARNRLEGIVREVEKGLVTAKIKVEIGAPSIVTAIISKEAVEDLNIKVGDKVEAVIKATEVMIAKEQ